MRAGLPRPEHGPVLAGVKAKPFGWPTASPDSGSGRRHPAASGSPPDKIRQNQVSTVSGDCHWLAIRNIEDKRARERAKEAGAPKGTPRTAPGKLVEGAIIQGWKAALGELALVYPDRIT